MVFAPYPFTRSDFWNAGQCFPVARNTSKLGSSRLLMLNTVHPRGNRGSQVTKKKAHCRQLGG